MGTELKLPQLIVPKFVKTKAKLSAFEYITLPAVQVSGEQYTLVRIKFVNDKVLEALVFPVA